jgi:hypothetical protein
MLGTPGIALLRFPRADAYTKRFTFLTKLVLPAGGLSLEENLPPREAALLAPAATLVVRADFHPALVDLVLVTAAAIHGGRGLLETPKQFPSPDHLEFPLMREAERFHTSGRRSSRRTCRSGRDAGRPREGADPAVDGKVRTSPAANAVS